MERITLEQLVSAVKGKLVGDFSSLQTPILEVDTDSRTLRDGSVFFALVGERFDAHDFICSNRGAQCNAGFVISKELQRYEPDKFYVLVQDTHQALGDLAKWYRRLFSIPFIAVTGSVGKTTAKDMIASVLSSKYNVHKTQGNFNNTIGLPLTMFQLQYDHQICVLEMGMDTLGEIDYMSNIVKPDVAVITNIGDAHIERLGSRDNIKKAKYEVLPHIVAQGLLLQKLEEVAVEQGHVGITIEKCVDGFTVNDNEIFGATWKEMYFGRHIQSDGIAQTTCDIALGTVETPYLHVEIPALGEHMVYPVMFAIAIGRHYNLTEVQLRQGIADFVPTKMRQTKVQLPQNITVFDDTYNANPQSMKAAVSVLVTHQGEKKIAVLGDMLELGDFSTSLHREVGLFVAEQSIDVLITVGERAKEIGEGGKQGGLSSVFCCNTKEQALNVLKDVIAPESTFLFKASRGIQLETLVSELVMVTKEKYKQS